MEIKTIREQRAPVFDEDVNRALAEGYRLHKRGIVPCPTNPHNTLFYAELVKLDTVEEPEPMGYNEALLTIKNTCTTAAECSRQGCPIWAWCDKHLPAHCAPDSWVIPEV